MVLTIQSNSNILFSQSESGTTISYTINGTTNSISSSQWPVTIQNTNVGSTPITCYFTSNIVFTTSMDTNSGLNLYFIIGSDNITFDGKYDNNNYRVNINGITDYLGLFQNGISGGTNGYKNIRIQNIGVTTENGSVLFSDQFNGGGWLCQRCFGYNISSGTITIQKCYSTVRHVC